MRTLDIFIADLGACEVRGHVTLDRRDRIVLIGAPKFFLCQGIGDPVQLPIEVAEWIEPKALVLIEEEIDAVLEGELAVLE